jgi:uncharacterized protein (TIGR02246 family)
MNRFAGIAFAASLVVMPVLAHAQSEPMDTKADIQKLATDWMNAYNKNDAATVAKMYADDALFSNPGWTASGRTAIADALNKDIAAGLFMINSITVDQSQRLGDMNYAKGTWTANMKGPDGSYVPVSGHWLTVGKCQGQSCLILDHNSNLQMPPPK